MNAIQALQSKRDEIMHIASEHGARDIRVFGSVARGEANDTSDLDLLIRLEPGYSLLELIAIKQDLEDLLKCEVDIVTEAALSPYIRDQVLQEATML